MWLWGCSSEGGEPVTPLQRASGHGRYATLLVLWGYVYFRQHVWWLALPDLIPLIIGQRDCQGSCTLLGSVPVCLCFCWRCSPLHLRLSCPAFPQRQTWWGPEPPSDLGTVLCRSLVIISSGEGTESAASKSSQPKSTERLTAIKTGSGASYADSLSLNRLLLPRPSLFPTPAAAHHSRSCGELVWSPPPHRGLCQLSELACVCWGHSVSVCGAC